MVLLKVLLGTLVSCQVIIYGGAISLNRYRPYYHSYPRFSSGLHPWTGERFLDSPFDMRPWTRTTTQRSIQLARTNKEYGNKLAKSEIMPNTFFVSDDQLPWDESVAACASQGMILASPQNKLQMHKLQNYLEFYDLIPTDVSGYWLGGRRKDDLYDHDFYWTSNGKKINDELWLPSEPNAYEGENCVEYKNSYDGMKLNNFYCELRRRFICQVVNHEENRKNDKAYQVVNNSTQESHNEIKKISNEGTAGASGKENSPTMTTTNASTNIISPQANTTTTSTTTTTPTTTTSTTTPMTTTPITTTTEEYYSGSHHLLPVADPFYYEYDE